jgi:hypothetical protein
VADAFGRSLTASHSYGHNVRFTVIPTIGASEHSGETRDLCAVTAAKPPLQPAISQHLRVLRKAGLIAERREGRQILYRAESTGLAPLVNWLSVYGVFWRERFANLKKLLKEMDRD